MWSTELSPHLALYGRWLMLPLISAGLLHALHLEGRFASLRESIRSGTYSKEDVEPALALLLIPPLVAVSLYNAYAIAVA